MRRRRRAADRVGPAHGVWSNGAVTDPDASESPWADDVPAPPNSSLPEDPWADRYGAGPQPTATAGPADRRGRHEGQPLDSGIERATAADDAGGVTGEAPGWDGTRRTWPLVAGATVVAVAIGSLVVGRGGDDDGRTETAVDRTPASADEIVAPVVPGDDGTSTTVPVLTPVLTPGDTGEPTLPDDETVVPTTVPLDALVPDLEPAPIGSPPVWTEWTYPVPPVLRQLAEATEVVALTTTGVLHRIEFPSGTVRSIDTGAAGRNAEMHVSGESLVLQEYDSLVLLRPDAPVREVAIGVGIGSVIPRGDTGEFLVAPNEWSGGPPPLWIVDATGEATSLATADNPLSTYADFPLQFLPTGELLVFDAGGTYVVPEAGTPERLSSGLLFATGRGHLIVRECDATLQCEYVVIDLATGDRRITPLDVVERFAFYSQGSVAPDGRTMLYADWSGARPVTLLMDLGSGEVVDDRLLRAAPLDFGPLDPWATDGSGVFLQTGSSVGFLTRDGREGVELDGLGAIASLAVMR